MPLALITGASGGIGLKLAEQFARSGYDLVLVARNEKRLHCAKDELSKFGGKIWVTAADLCEPESPQEILHFVEQNGLFVDALVNNAGFGLYGSFSENDLGRELERI